MDIIRVPAEMISWSEKARASGLTIGLVPTMGYFHGGHLSLMRKAADRWDRVVVSLFVNPIQFCQGEDLHRYPRDFDRDRGLAEKEGVDVLFAPPAEEMYLPGASTRVVVAGISDRLCGKSRPGHFEGVTTVVAKLFNLAKPHGAVFGQKDFQQLALIRKMTRDLNWNIEIVGHPIVREADGLAMSSRNSYLSGEERRSALYLYQAINQARRRAGQGMTDPVALVEELQDLAGSFPGVEVEYINFVDRENLEDVGVVGPGTVLVLAAKVGRTRLIDNALIFENIELELCCDTC